MDSTFDARNFSAGKFSVRNIGGRNIAVVTQHVVTLHLAKADATAAAGGVFLAAACKTGWRAGAQVVAQVSLLMTSLMSLLLTGCGGGGGGGSTAAADSAPEDSAPSAQASLGEKNFADASLLASGAQACATGHVAEQGHGPRNALAAQLDGPALQSQDIRSAPSIRYLGLPRSFRLAADGAPSGGFFWDGRDASLLDQAGRPFLSTTELANGSLAEAVTRLARATYAEAFKRVFGADIFSRPDAAFDRMTLALQQYQLEDPEFRPFSSKYDEFLRDRAALTTTELRGLAWFNSPDKGNCAACHPSAKGADGSLPLSTDFSRDNLGVPRSAELERNADAGYFDLGLCAREGGDMAARADLCGAFKVPSLRNVALRGALFHNGRFKTLKDALGLYVQRDTNPEKFYPADAQGQVLKFDDLPPQYRRNVNTTEAPYNRQPGQAPALNNAEIDELIAFLHTLTDGFKP